MKVGDLVRKTKKSKEHNDIGHLRGIVLEVHDGSPYLSDTVLVFWSVEYGTFCHPASLLEKVQ